MNQKGQALVSIILISTFAIIVITSLTIVGVSLNQKRLGFEQSQKAYYLSETGLEEAFLNLLRNPDYAGGEFSIDGTTINITISILQSNPNWVRKKLDAVAVINNIMKTVTATVEIETKTNKITVLPETWREI